MFFSRVTIRPDIERTTQFQYLILNNGYGCHQLLRDLLTGEPVPRYLYREEIAKEQLGRRAEIRGQPIYYLVSAREPVKDNPLFYVESKPYSPKIRPGERLFFKLRANPVVARKISDAKKSSRHDVVMDAQLQLLDKLEAILGSPNRGKKSQRIQTVLAALRATSNHSAVDCLKSTISKNERYHQDHLNQENTPPQLLRLALKACADRALELWLIRKGQNSGFELVRGEQHDQVKFQAESYRWHALPTKGRKAGFSSVDFEGVLRVSDPQNLIDALFNGIGPAKAFGCGLLLIRRI